MNGNQAVAKDVAEESAAAKAGIKSDDVLAAFNGTPITNGKDLDAAIRANGAREATLTVVRKGETVMVHAKPTLMTVEFAGATWYFPGAQVGDLAHQKGPIKIGDKLLAVNGRKIANGEQLVAAVRGTDKVSLELKRLRREKPLQLTVATGDVKSAVSESFGLLGFLPQFEFIKMDYVDSLKAGWQGTKDLIGAIFASLAPQKIGENVGGPILIARQTSITVDLGPYYVVQLAAMLSLSLAVMNLFPIPIFDGGHLALLAIEAVRRRRLTREQMQWVQMAGLAIIGMLILTIFFSDISKWAGGKLPQ
jgi:regulator of sigma E protease